MRIGSVGMTPVESVPMSTNSGAAAEVQKMAAPVKAAPVQKPSFGNSAADTQDKEWELMEKPIEQANKSLAVYDRRVDRVIHDVTKTMMYTITDTRTNEVIAEYPPKKIQDMIAKMWELAGLFVDERA